MSTEQHGFVAIINPAAGGGRSGRRGAVTLSRLRQGGVQLDDIRTTRAPGDAMRYASEAWRAGARRFLVVGGDGTSHEVLNGCLEARSGGGGEGTPTIGMLPLGTGNSFLRDVGIFGEDDAVRALLRGTSRASDVLRIDHAAGATYAFNIVGLGFSAEVGARTNARYKPLGAAGYVVAVLETAVNLKAPSYPLRLDGGETDPRPVVLLSFCNSRFTAGAMEMAPRAQIDDGEMDVIRIAAMPRLRFVAQFPSIFRGTHVQRSEVEARRARHVALDLPGEVDCMIDGEVMRLWPRALEVVPQAMQVIA